MKYVMRLAAAAMMMTAMKTWMPLYAAELAADERPADEQVAAGHAAEEQSIEETVAEREALAKSLFEGRCQMCHQLPEPGMLKPAQWKLILMTMQQRMQHANVPPLTEDETERLLEYLSARAR